MRRIFVMGMGAAMALAGSAAMARAVVDGRLQVEPASDGVKYIVDNSKLGKAEFFGYVGDFVDNKKITAILLLKGDKATDEQKHVISITAATQHIEAFVDQGGKVQPLVDPTPPPAAAPPPPPPSVEGQTPAPPAEGQTPASASGG